MQLKYLKTQCKKIPPFELLRRSVPIFWLSTPPYFWICQAMFPNLLSTILWIGICMCHSGEVE